MPAFKYGLISTVVAALVACSAQTEAVNESAPWVLDPAESGMTYITIKNGELGEINTFREFNGQVDTDGSAVFTIALDSVDTANEIRDPRMREHVFKTTEFPTATARTQVDLAQFQELPVGESETVLLDVTLGIAGYETQRDFYVQVTRLGVNKVVVTNKAP